MTPFFGKTKIPTKIAALFPLFNKAFIAVTTGREQFSAPQILAHKFFIYSNAIVCPTKRINASIQVIDKIQTELEYFDIDDELQLANVPKLNTIASNQCLLNDFASAQTTIQKALTIVQVSKEERARFYLADLYVLQAIVEQHKEEFFSAIHYLNEALKLNQAIVGDKIFSDTYKIIFELALAHLAVNNFSKAELYFKQLANASHAISEPPSINTCLSILCSLSNKHDEALYYQQESIKHHQAQLGENLPLLAIDFNNLAVIYHKIAQPDQANMSLEKAFGILNKFNYPANHPLHSILTENQQVLKNVVQISSPTTIANNDLINTSSLLLPTSFSP
jgi:tetratricopeptide (TPR) repeat protein